MINAECLPRAFQQAVPLPCIRDAGFLQVGGKQAIWNMQMGFSDLAISAMHAFHLIATNVRRAQEELPRSKPPRFSLNHGCTMAAPWPRFLRGLLRSWPAPPLTGSVRGISVALGERQVVGLLRQGLGLRESRDRCFRRLWP